MEPLTVPVSFSPSKPYTDHPTRVLGRLEGFTPGAAAVTRSRFGGWADRRLEATGFFRAQRVGERWWLVDPEGCLFLHVAVVSVRPERTPTCQAALTEQFGSDAAWAQAATAQLWDLGFNGSGAWTADALLRASDRPLVYTTMMNFMSTFAGQRGLTHTRPGHKGYVNDCIPVFHPDFPAFCDEYARQQVAATRDDPYLLGHFSDNEMPFPNRLLDKTLELDPENADMAHNLREAQRWLEQRKGKPASAEDITDEDRRAWQAHVAQRYLELTTAAIRKYDPNHMCLGPRFYSDEKHVAEVWEVAGRYLDAIGVNLYHAWSPDPKQMADWARWSGRPFIITEWYAKGMDSGLPNFSGAGWTVPTQADRGRFYQNFTLGLLESGVCVGWHWFKYMDNDPNNPRAEPSNVDSNKGMVTIDFQLYTPLGDRMKALNDEVYPLTDYFDRKRGQ